MRFASILLLGAAAVSAAFPGEARAAGETREPAAVAVAQRTLDAMGGAKGFEALRTLEFEFVVARDGKDVSRWRHAWDRWDGRYRLEGKSKEGKAVLTIFNVRTPTEGRSWLDGVELTGDPLKRALDYAYNRFINDTYWLLMPAKLLDPGVNLALEPPATIDGKTFDVVRATFNDVGLTPKDTYWAYVAKDTGLMDRWEMVLTGQTAADRSAYTWTAWAQAGPVRLSLLKTAAPGGAFAIRFDNVAGSTSPDDAAFAAP